MMVVSSPKAMLLLLWFVCKLSSFATAKRLKNTKYALFPRRTREEAAVLEWGHSAIISALDASVATFGPQTSQAALLEVECQPVLASPLNGVFPNDEKLRPLDNADDVHGNMVVMTNKGDITGVQMAKIAKLSGAAALLVVNLDEERPDDIYRLEPKDGETAEDIDIPVVMISMNSANVLTSATVTPEMSPSEIVNHGMPERVRLYAGGDRPFFEDVEPMDPTLYLIHNLLTSEECDELVNAAENKVTPVAKNDVLQQTHKADNYVNIERVMLWQGMLQSPAQKQIEERIEQVTGFPSSHYTNFIVDRLQPESSWKPHYDSQPGTLEPHVATITVFLSDVNGAMIYPKCREPVKIQGRKGMAVVHHNADENHALDKNTLYSMEGPDAGPVYVAQKFIQVNPESNARRLALPIFAAPFGGKLPQVIVTAHNALVENFGLEQGNFYFEKICVFLPMLILLAIAQYIGESVTNGMRSGKSQKPKKKKKNE